MKPLWQQFWYPVSKKYKYHLRNSSTREWFQSIHILFGNRDTNTTHAFHMDHRNYVRLLQWRHNQRYGVSNHQHHDSLLNRLFRRRSRKPWKPRVTGICGGIHRTGDRRTLRTKGQWRGKCVHLMKSPWWMIFQMQIMLTIKVFRNNISR